MIGGGTPDTMNDKYWGGDIKWFTPTEVGHQKYISNSRRTITVLGLEESSAKTLPANSVLLSSRATVGECSINTCQCATNQGFQSLVPKTNQSSEFIYYLALNLKRYFIKHASGSTFLEISNSEVRTTPCYVPDLTEQKRISDFLSLLDLKIEKIQRLIDLLKSYKRGVSEAIFSQSHQLQTQGVFKWSTYRFGDLGFFYNGLSGKSKEDFGKGCASYIPYMNVFSNPVADDSFLGFVSITKNERQNSVAYGDLLFTQSSETLEEIGYSSVWLGKSEPFLNSFCFGFRFYDFDSVDPLYFAHYFRSSAIRNAIMREGQGATRVNLSAERLKNMEVKLPVQTTQQYIGQQLQKIQQLINCAHMQLTELLALKNGLLQQLFI